MSDFDAIVIGSGFGGAITACRLAEAGYRSSSSSAGGAGTAKNFPREAGRPVALGPPNAAGPEHGWFDLRILPTHVGDPGRRRRRRLARLREHLDRGEEGDVRHGLASGNHVCRARRALYALVGKMLNVKPVPQRQWPERTKLMRDAAGKTGAAIASSRSSWRSASTPTGITQLPNPHSHRPVEDVSKRAGPDAGDVRAPWQLRHRLRRERAQHARPQLPGRSPRSTAPRFGRCIS